MGIQIALNHQTTYRYDRMITLSPHVVRLRPAPHCRTPILAYSLKVTPQKHFINWQQDPHGNFLARLVFPELTNEFKVEVDLVADMTVINPFDFFLEPTVDSFPFTYAPALSAELKPFLEIAESGPLVLEYLKEIPRTPTPTIPFLVDLNRRLQKDIEYIIRLETGVQTGEETLQRRKGSCRDTAWLLIQVLRHIGLAARFVSGYLIQLFPDEKPLEGPPGPSSDFSDLHAWAEVYLPGAGWIGLDPTSGLMAGEGHIPLAATPHPVSAAPIEGFTEKCETQFSFSTRVSRYREGPRVTKPYTTEQWQALETLGAKIDADLLTHDVRLTMGGEPTFVSATDMESPEWNTEALGPAKEKRSFELLQNLFHRWCSGGFLHFGQGKWYPGEPLPRWAMSAYWREDQVAVWANPALFANPAEKGTCTTSECQSFLDRLARNLGVDPAFAVPAFEDAFYYLWKERRLPPNVDPREADLKKDPERRRLAELLDRGLGEPVGFVLPLESLGGNRWGSGPWQFRSPQFFLIPGDSPIGFRLPLDSLPWLPKEKQPTIFGLDPFTPRKPLSSIEQQGGAQPLFPRTSEADDEGQTLVHETGDFRRFYGIPGESPRTALCVQERNGQLFVFLPPMRFLEHYLDMVRLIEKTAAETGRAVVIEGYPPPADERLKCFKITPDPGVIEVNIPPAATWIELTRMFGDLFELGRATGLGAEKFMLDGRHSGTGGGNHVVLGGRTPVDSPFLRRPDLLRSMVCCWNNHPSLSYLFSNLFIGPTSQAPRADEGRHDILYELDIAFQQVPVPSQVPPWLVDRLFRHLLVDVTGNTHRAEFCIDKLFSPDHAGGRLGLVEIRSFEMVPHSRMVLAQLLLVRGLVARFWRTPYRQPLVRWGTAIHDRFMLPFYLFEDLKEVLHDLNESGYEFFPEGFLPHLDFRFPLIGSFVQQNVGIELRQAAEPWYVLGEEPGSSGTTRFVDSSLERLQVRVTGLTSSRFCLACNGRRVPLKPTGTAGEFVGGVRFRAWQPPSCLQPTIPVATPLVFDLLDTWSNRSVGGCTYHAAHPGGRNYQEFPKNSLEAEARRAARFFVSGHTPGTCASIPPAEENPEFPCTLDLRRRHEP